MAITKAKQSNAELKAQKEAERAAISLWILRILVELDGNMKLLNRWGFESNEIAKFIGLNQFIEGEYDIPSARKEIHALYKQHSKNRPGNALPSGTDTGRNIELLAKRLGLSHTEKAILHFTVMVKTSTLLSEAIELLGMTKPSIISRIFACCLQLDLVKVTKAMRTDGMLNKSGVLSLEPEGYGIDMKLNLLPGLIDAMDAPGQDPIDMFGSSFFLSAEPKLGPEDYPHLKEDIALLRQYIRHVYKQQKRGVNILIYGPPGTGKSELARMMALASNSQLYEIGFEGKTGAPLKSAERFRAYRTAQTLFSRHRRHMILFDEVEDVFVQTEEDQEKKGNASGHKAWVNKVLEENPVPAFWLTNNVHTLDRAYVRRFDFVIGIDTPPKSVRHRVLDTYLEGTAVSEECKRQLSAHDQLSPATIERASSMLKAIGASSLDADHSLHRIIGNTLEAMGSTRPIMKRNALELNYSVELLNADCDVARVSQGIVEAGQGRICLYGPPGTGKSAFGRYVAELTRKPLLVKRASDIISPLLGESERNMARMFSEAKDLDAVLVLDEADTYLQDRRHLQRSWEVSGVNEMLTQIEAFEGVFLCSTNLIDTLDTAALRRFDVKIRFDYLKADHAWKLFKDCATRLGVDYGSQMWEPLSRLNLLTPGDFATVLRLSRLRPVLDAKDLLSRLEAECRMKPEGKVKSIGFH